MDVSLAITRCTFLRNRVVKSNSGDLGVGGAIYISSSEGSIVNVDLENTIFEDEYVVTLGSALYTTNDVFLVISNCSFNYDIKEKGVALASILSIDGHVLTLKATRGGLNANFHISC